MIPGLKRDTTRGNTVEEFSNSRCERAVLVVGLSSCPESNPKKVVILARPILENSTACTMSNAKNYLVRLTSVSR